MRSVNGESSDFVEYTPLQYRRRYTLMCGIKIVVFKMGPTVRRVTIRWT